MAEEWKNDFLAFVQCMGEPPTPEHEVGRIDNNLGYVAGNVRWETRTENMRNTRRTVWITWKERQWCLKELCDELDLNYKKSWNRIRKLGWSFERCINADK